MRLYHCLYQEPRGEALLPLSERIVNGREGSFLYASPYLTKALAFAFSYHQGEIECNGGIDGTNDEFVVVNDRVNTLARDRHLRVYAFSDAGFEMTPDPRQCVSTNALPFDRTELIFETTSLDDVMAAGVQIFAMSQPRLSLEQCNFLDGLDRADSCESWLLELVREQGAIWENAERKINPNKVLQERFDNLIKKKPA